MASKLTCVVLALSVATMMSLSAKAGVVWTSLVVRSIESKSFSRKEMRAIIETLGLSVGGGIDRKRVNDGIRRLVADGKLQKLLLIGSINDDGVYITISGNRVRPIRNVTFERIDPEILESAKRGLDLKVGQSGDIAAFSELRDRLKNEYRNRGYQLAEIEIIVKDAPDDRIDVSVAATANNPTIVSSLTLTGGPPSMNENLKGLMGVKKGDVFSKRGLDEGVEAINQYLRANQYPTSKVEKVDVDFSDNKLSVDIKVLLRIEERYQFRFSGNTVFQDEELREILSSEIVSQVDAPTRIADDIEKKYRAVGYHFCRVKIENEVLEKEHLNIVRFSINENSKVLVDRVYISGGGELGGSKIESLFWEGAPGILRRHVFWEEGLQTAVDNLRKQLTELGYLSSSVSNPKATFTDDKKGVEIFFEVDIGQMTRIAQLDHRGVFAFPISQLDALLGVRVGDPVNRGRLEEGKKRILDLYQREGFLDARFADEKDVPLIVLSSDRRECTVQISIIEGVQYYVGKISVTGNKKTKDEVILREMKVATSDRYNPQLVRRSEEDIELLGLFSRVELITSTSVTQNNRKDINIVVSESKPGLGEMGLGGVYEEPRFRLRSFLGVVYQNLGGFNQTASARMQLVLPFSSPQLIPFVEYSAVLGYRAPYPLGLPVTFIASIGLDGFEVQATTPPTLQKRARVEGKIEKKISKIVTAVYRIYRYDRITTEVLSTSATTEGIGSTGPGVIVDFRDDMFNPTSGSYHTLDIELAHPLLLSSGNSAFTMAIWKNSFYSPLLAPLRLALYAGAGWAKSLNAVAIPEARLVNDLSLGGQNSIRGFDLRQFSPPVGGLETAFFNVRGEIGTELFPNLGIALFADSGQIIPLAGDQSTSRHDGVGCGFRYKTPVGPVVVDFAYGLGPDNVNKSVKFYFTVGTI